MMKIAEIVGSYADQKASVAPDSSLLQTIANAFTRSGKVKRPLNQQLGGDGQVAAHLPFPSHAAADEDSAPDAVSNTNTDAPPIPTTQLQGAPRNATYWAAARWAESSF